jgi:hypothetical protein
MPALSSAGNHGGLYVLLLLPFDGHRCLLLLSVAPGFVVPYLPWLMKDTTYMAATTMFDANGEEH